MIASTQLFYTYRKEKTEVLLVFPVRERTAGYEASCTTSFPFYKSHYMMKLTACMISSYSPVQLDC